MEIPTTCATSPSHNGRVTTIRPPRPGYEYRFVTRALHASGHLKALKVAVGLLCISMVPLATIAQLHPMGPHGTWPRIVHAAATASALVVGTCWIALPWPSRRLAIAFVFWADAVIAIGSATYSAPPAQLCGTIHMGLIGMYAACLLGRRVLAAHCVFATLTIVGMTWWGIHASDATLLDLYIYYAPALSVVVILPLLTQAVIDGARVSVRSASFAATRDALTGLLNRWGARTALATLLRVSAGTGKTAVVLIIDVDYFKTLNDTFGHEAGDATLKAFADALQSVLRSEDIAARIGGDEFMAVALLDNTADIQGFVARVRALRPESGIPTASISVGAAWQSTDDKDFSVDQLIGRADVALYDAKRNRANRVGRPAPTRDHR